MGCDADAHRRSLPVVESLGRVSGRRSLRSIRRRDWPFLRLLPAKRRVCGFGSEPAEPASAYVEPLDAAAGRLLAILGFLYRQPHSAPVVEPRAQPGTVHSRELCCGPVWPHSSWSSSSTSGANTAARRLLTLANPTWGPWYSTIAYLDAGATSSYNGLLLSAQHRLANNFSVLANWTYSHCLADPSTTELTGPSYVDSNNRADDRSSCSADHRQQVNISGVLTSPHVTGFLGVLANGWQASPIFHWSTGNLTSATYGTDVALTGAGN